MLVTGITEAHILAIRTDQERRTVSCGHVIMPDLFLVSNWRDFENTPGMGASGTAGYAIVTDENGEESHICYACANAREVERIRTADRFSAYLSTDGKIVTTWPGGKLGTVTYANVSRAARKVFVRVTDVYGNKWYGQGPAESGTYVNLRRVKNGK